MTPVELITVSLKKIGVLGVGQTALAEDLNDALVELNMMISQWAIQRYMIYHLVQNSITCTGAVSYTIGPLGDIPMSARPSLIEAAFVRQLNNAAPNQVDYPLIPIPSRENYNQIAIKQLAAFPQFFYYDAAYPLGIIYPYPVPNNQYALHITTRAIFSQFTNLTQDIVLPPEYEQALVYNLSGLLATSYDKDVPAAVSAIARASKSAIRATNAQIPNANIPPGLTRGPLYNIYSDSTY